MVYLPTNLPSKSPIHVDKYTKVAWILWVLCSLNVLGRFISGLKGEGAGSPIP